MRIGLADLPNVPYRYVFRQLSSEVSHLHRRPLKSCQSAEIRTTVVWDACERKSRSSVCTRSKVGLPICLYPFLMQSTVHQIFIKVLNVTVFPITLHSLRFMMHAKTKPNSGLRDVAFSWASFDLWPPNHINFGRFHVQIIKKLKIWSNWYIAWKCSGARATTWQNSAKSKGIPRRKVPDQKGNEMTSRSNVRESA